MVNYSGLHSASWEVLEKRVLVLYGLFSLLHRVQWVRLGQSARWTTVPTTATYEAPPKERRGSARTLADELEYSADRLLHMRDRVSLLGLIKALLRAFRSGEQEIDMTPVNR